MLTKDKTGVIFLVDSISTQIERVLTRLKGGEELEHLELDDRKTKILKSIIKNYLDTGEPVGSRTISKILDLQLSSATIRNEMSDLEEMGYIVQPHTSAGRIPSDKGYRFYVDQLIFDNEEQVSEMKEYVIEKTERMEKVLQQVVKLLATNLNYATMITSPSINGSKVKFIQLSTVDSEQILAVIVMEGNIVKNKIIPVSEPLDNETLLKLNMLLNTTLNGIPFEQIHLGLITRLKDQAGIYGNIVNDVLDAIATALKEDEDLEVYTSGANNLIKYPELFDSGSAGELLTAFEEKQVLAEMLTDELKDVDGSGIQVYIGSESSNSKIRDCSIVTATYDLGEGMQGKIGIIGPKRMDYENVMKSLKKMKGQLDDAFHKGHDA